MSGTDLPTADGSEPEPALEEFVQGEIGTLLTERKDWFAGFDLLMFCTPESVVTAHLPAAVSIEGPVLYSDICSVKSRIAAAV